MAAAAAAALRECEMIKADGASFLSLCVWVCMGTGRWERRAWRSDECNALYGGRDCCLCGGCGGFVFFFFFFFRERQICIVID